MNSFSKILAFTSASLFFTACDNANDTVITDATSDVCPKGLLMLPYNPETFPYGQSALGILARTSSVKADQREFDIVIRDFDVSHPDFENFQEEAWNSITNGKASTKDGDIGDLSTWLPSYQGNADWMARRSDLLTYGCGNTSMPQLGMAIGSQGYPKEIAPFTTVPNYISAISGSTPQGYAWYGEFSDCATDAKLNPLGLKTLRGFVSELCNASADAWPANAPASAKMCSSSLCKTHQWSNIVYTTPGMVKQHLEFNGNDMLSARIQQNRQACDNVWFDQWYSDEPGINKRINTTLILEQDATDPKYFEIDKNWNNGGFFPLDSVSENGNFTWLGPKTGFEQFGAQSLSIFCPPYNYQYASSQKDFMGNSTAALCNAWKAAGGPKVGAAAQTAAVSDPTGLRHLRNYGFTMMGYAAFKYKKGQNEVFKIAGDDDIWVFVDGVLVTDLGGVHLPAAGTADMDYLAMNSHGCHAGDPLQDSCAVKLDADGSWKDQSWHHLHFFYADRQTDGSNLRIRSSLSELAKSSYGQPAVNGVSVKNENGNQTTSILLNSVLDEETYLNLHQYGATIPTILVMRSETEASTGAVTTKVYGYYVTAITAPVDKGTSGILYQMSGILMDANGTVINTGILNGDKVAFNFPYNDEIAHDDELKAAYVSTVGAATWSELLAWNSKMSFEIKSTNGKTVSSFPDTPSDEDWITIADSKTRVQKIIRVDSDIEGGEWSAYNFYSSVKPGSLIVIDAEPGELVCQLP